MFKTSALGDHRQGKVGLREQFHGMLDSGLQQFLMDGSIQLCAEAALQDAARESDLSGEFVDMNADRRLLSNEA
jgi:hypothetical protein